MVPDIIFARGGLPVYDKSLNRYPNAYKIYYGAGKRFLPTGGIRYNLVLVDSMKQWQKANAMGLNAKIFNKPAAPHFRPIKVTKKYDVCYVGDGRFGFRAKIKGLKWLYKTAPKWAKILHLGWNGKYSPPDNVKVKRVRRGDMPYKMSMCKVGVVPYTSYDSAPRVIPEMTACGLPIVASDEVNFARGSYTNAIICNRDKIWDNVRLALRQLESVRFAKNSVESCANEIRRLM